MKIIEISNKNNYLYIFVLQLNRNVFSILIINVYLMYLKYSKSNRPKLSFTEGPRLIVLIDESTCFNTLIYSCNLKYVLSW